MKIQVGCDLVYIPKFIDSIERSGQAFLEKIFTSHELAHVREYESLAGIFAVKEAFLKASGLKLGSWHAMEIFKLPSGKPALRLPDGSSYQSIDVSISHDGDYALAVVVILMNE